MNTFLRIIDIGRGNEKVDEEARPSRSNLPSSFQLGNALLSSYLALIVIATSLTFGVVRQTTFAKPSFCPRLQGVELWLLLQQYVMGKGCLSSLSILLIVIYALTGF